MAGEIVKDLGKVTAYAYAKAAGYTGTEEQFQQVFDEFTRNAPGLLERLDDAVADAEAAQAAAETAVTNANTAKNAAEAAQAAAQQTAQDMDDSVQQITTNKNDISDLMESFTQIDLENKLWNSMAVPDGSKTSNCKLTKSGKTFHISGGSSNSTFRCFNITGSEIKARTGKLADISLFATDFVSATPFRQLYDSGSIKFTPFLYGFTSTPTYMKLWLVRRKTNVDPNTNETTYSYSRQEIFGGTSRSIRSPLIDTDYPTNYGFKGYDDFAIYITITAQPVTREITLGITLEKNDIYLTGANKVENNLDSLNAYNVGDTFIRGLYLVRAKTSIAENDTLAKDTNYEIIDLNYYERKGNEAVEKVNSVVGDALGDNLLPIGYFSSRYGDVTSSPVGENETDAIIINNDTTTTYAGRSTRKHNPNTQPIGGILEVGKRYRMHCKAEVLSGNPYICMAIRSSSDTAVVSVTPTDGSDAYVDFTATSAMNYVSLFVSWSTSTQGSSIKYSEIWIKEILGESCTDLIAREDIIDLAIKEKYMSEMKTTISTLQKVATEPCLIFPLVTDIHYYSDDNVRGAIQFNDTIENIKYFADNVRCDGLICLGDITDGGYSTGTPTSVKSGKPIVDKLMKMMRSVNAPLFFTLGNHDDFRYVTTYMTANDIYSHYFQPSSNSVIPNTETKGTDYYCDFVGQKVRLICINTNILPTSSTAGAYGVSTKTVSWLSDVLDNMPEDFLGVVITHAPLYRALLWDTAVSIPNVASAQSAINSSGKRVVVLTGHSHFNANYYPANGFLCVTSGPTKVDGPTQDSTVETYGGQLAWRYARDMNGATADLWDVVVVKPYSGKINYIRFGAGVDQTFNYNPITTSEAVTLTTELTGTVSWASSDTTIATVADGVVTIVSSGRACITATDETGNIEFWWIDTTA